MGVEEVEVTSPKRRTARPLRMCDADVRELDRSERISFARARVATGAEVARVV
jgi:hypothetical protein